MSNLVIDIIGYAAAVVTNISIFPQAYDVFIIINTAEYNKLIGISSYMFFLQCSGCVLWFTYAYMTNLFPIMVGSISCFVPSSYILCMVLIYKPTNTIIENNEKNESSEVIVSSSVSFNNELYNNEI